jgi:hypothetical protein
MENDSGGLVHETPVHGNDVTLRQLILRINEGIVPHRIVKEYYFPVHLFRAALLVIIL